MTFRKGDWVLVNLPSGPDATVTEGMKKYHGIVVQVSKVCRKKTKKGTKDQPVITYSSIPSVYGYELDGVVSPYGIPYTFIPDFLYPANEY